MYKPYNTNFGQNNYSGNSVPYNGPMAPSYHQGYQNNRVMQYASNNTVKPKKMNGCKTFVGKNKTEYISGWYYSQNTGLIKVLIFRTGKSDKNHTSDTGKIWQSVAAKVTFVNRFETKTFSALYDVAANRVSIKDMNFILSPNKNYCGPAFKKK